jgi:putative transposon-encoded protein
LPNKLHLEEEIDAIIDGEVKKMGNGVMVIASKKYIGKKVYIFIRKTESLQRKNAKV